jgi:anionic cell wall polymer biosynthesis LytR-Cps2A-Psr (LCP) family protein
MNDSSSAPEASPQQPKTPSRIRTSMKRVFKWTLSLVLLWWLVSAVVPGVPSPARGGKALFSVFKSISDDLYHAANKNSLEEAAKMVQGEATEHRPESDSGLAGADRLPVERRKRLPSVPVSEDSALRTTMTAISKTPVIRGRVINILLVGIDSRMGTRSARADALHLITVNPDSAVVEIMSIPRDTYCDLGYPDTTTFNIITNARAAGYPGFLKKVQDLTNRGPIKYYIEVGFSQALGVLEMLGYNDPVNTLKFLRTRKSLPAGDIQRSYNQAVFVRQNLLSKFSLFTGATGELILTAGLNFVETNLTREFCKGLIYALEQRGFPDHRPDAVRVRVLPLYKIRLKEMTADSVTVARTIARTKQIVQDDPSPNVNVTALLRRHVASAIEDSSRPGKVISRLKRLSEQHAWLQIQDFRARIGVRDSLLHCLERAYRRQGNNADADRVVDIKRSEDVLIQRQKKN